MFVYVCTTYLLLLWCLCSWTVEHNIYNTQKNGRSYFGILYIRLLKIKLLDKYWWCIWCMLFGKNECHHSLEENFRDGSLPSRFKLDHHAWIVSHSTQLVSPWAYILPLLRAQLHLTYHSLLHHEHMCRHLFSWTQWQLFVWHVTFWHY